MVPRLPDANASAISLNNQFVASRDTHFIPQRSPSRVSSVGSTPRIGVAIGSPTRNIYIEGPNNQYTPVSINSGSIPAFFLPAEPLVMRKGEGKGGHRGTGEQQEGGGRWRKFFQRSLFGSKKNSAAATAAVAAAEATAASQPPIPKTPGPRTLVRVQPSTPMTARPVTASRPITFSKPIPISRPMTASRPKDSLESSSFLDVNIPQVEMERYSVMFKAFLQGDGAQPYSPRLGQSAPKSSTLYDRRRSRDLLSGGGAVKVRLYP